VNVSIDSGGDRDISPHEMIQKLFVAGFSSICEKHTRAVPGGGDNKEHEADDGTWFGIVVSPRNIHKT
jgi:hypothetical protein